jgi:perosamine synthetase
MLCTESAEIAERARLMSLHGMTRDAWERYTEAGSWYYEVVAPGFKYNMPDIAAAIGLAQMVKAGEMWTKRKKIAAAYTRAFSGFPELQSPTERVHSEHAWHIFALRLNLDALSIDRSGFIEALNGRAIGASVHFIPLHIHPYYAKKYAYASADYPIALREYEREISLPIYSGMTEDEVDRVIHAVADIVATNRRS